jgi:hypothetical protein
MTHLYNDFGQPATSFLDRLCATKLLEADPMLARDQLKAIRESLKLSVREFAVGLGDAWATKYTYYEETRYTSEHIPLRLARAVAELLARHHRDPLPALKLAGLEGPDREREAAVISAMSERSAGTVLMPVQLPNADTLSDMFRGMLDTVPAETPRPDVAQKLARLLPGALAQLQPQAGSGGLPAGFDSGAGDEAGDPARPTDNRD